MIDTIKKWIIKNNGYLIITGIFLISLVIKLQDSIYLTGDSGIIHLISQDFSRGNLISAYFYGQAYFGNLYGIYYGLYYFLFGDSMRHAMVYEHFTYYSSALILYSTLVRPKLLTTIFFGLGWFFYFRFLDIYTFSLSYPFLIFMITVSYYLCHNIEQKGFDYLKLFITGLIFSLSIWHNLIYSVTLPVVFSLYLIHHAYKSRAFWKDVLVIFGGFSIGIIPFIIGYYQTSGANLKWFFLNSSGSKIESIKYWLREVLFYFSPHYRQTSLDGLISAFERQPVHTLYNLMPSFLIASFLVCGIIYLVVNFKKHRVHVLYLSLLVLFLLIKNVTTSEYILKHVRYIVFIHPLLILLFAKVLQFSLLSSKNTWFNSICRIGTLVIIIHSFGTIYTGTNASVEKNTLYEVIYKDLVEKDINSIYCEKYNSICVPIYTLSERSMIIEMYGPKKYHTTRLPYHEGEVEDLFNKGFEPVYAVFRPDTEVGDDYQVVKEYELKGKHLATLYTINFDQINE